ncbi:hypothetical protein [Actinomadura parmotrematis]|uniref:pPIWI-RE three-gene island domain-containing protein n=1 Tax=Actinomadura parmotrematis TaxID=2864039 RepID=A0ABS7FYN5_9ACTN|nr:hypothetical protein [Actinomadura parmotrematis]MBW8485564.1 hypothetical protein [Actinomadura parmotrematis]
MRERESWHRRVSGALRKACRDTPDDLAALAAVDVCQVELALHLLHRLLPSEPAEGAYTLLSGFPFARAAGGARTAADETALAAARHLLWTKRRRRTWHEDLESYRAVPERLRGFAVPPGGAPVRLDPAVAAGRFGVYDDALAAPPPFVTRGLKLAPAGRSTFLDRRRATSVSIPDELVFDRPQGHDLAVGGPSRGVPLTVSRAELRETAAWMDARERAVPGAPPGFWEDRLAELRIAPRDAAGTGFTDRDSLTLDGLLHMVGMVGAGKSTLMVLVAVWAARRPEPLRTTLVVGDVAEQLRLTALLKVLGVPVAPVLGASTRETHVQRLHRRLAARGRENLLDHDDAGFDELGTVCVLDALRGTEAARPLRFADAPCVSLYPERPRPAAASLLPPGPAVPDEAVPAAPSGAAHGCPVWERCPRHHTARSAVDALVWVANPASLVQSGVPAHLNDERVRYLELACRRSDIVFVDEADAVQMRLDDVFAPKATLVQPGPDSWLDELATHKIEELSQAGRLPLADTEIERWNSCLNAVNTATDKLYRILISDGGLRGWIDLDYFSPWTLQERLLAEWFADADRPDPHHVPDERALFETYPDVPDVPDGAPAPPSAAAPPTGRRAELTQVFDDFRDDPLGGGEPRHELTRALVDLTRDLLHTLLSSATRKRTRALLRDLVKDTPAADADEVWAQEACRNLEFTLVLSALNHRLERLTYLWPQVEAALRLEVTGNELARRPPQDYAPVIPEAPMGNVLGFQYLTDDRDRDEDGRQSGTLRFFRCAGVGRELLLALHRLGADPGAGRAGPHVVLMSGTSWAGGSSRAHLPVPVGAVLKPTAASLEAVARTTFATLFVRDGEGRPISLSGAAPNVRPGLARSLVHRLGSPGPGGAASLLDRELAGVGDDGRKRALLLVGSYKEADLAAGVLHDIDRWHGRVRVLVPDDARGDAARPPMPQAGRAAPLRRGDLASFAADASAEVLVAPLMAVERGHNILNSAREAAFGTALFLVRPHPRPDDLSLAVFAVNDWAARFVRDRPRRDDRTGPRTFTDLVARAGGLDRAGLDFRREARQEWRRLLSRRYVYSRLPAWEKDVFAWDQLVTLWQVIGRLVRGGVPARVVFVDAAFAPATARRGDGGPVTDGLLESLHRVLGPYFAAPGGRTFDDPADPAVARLLYEPLYNALAALTGGPEL